MNNSTPQEEWMRICPQCKITKTIYKNKVHYHRAIKENRVCASCFHKNRIGFKHSDDTKRKMCESHTGKKYTPKSEETRRKLSGKVLSKETKQKISISTMRAMKDPKIREKLRIATINDLKKKGIFPSGRNYNPTACQFIENYGKENGYNFQHAMNGGEVELYGYFVDGYDKEKNIIIEYDELCHKHRKNKDLQRQNDLIEYFKLMGTPLKMFIRVLAYNNEKIETFYGEDSTIFVPPDQ